MKQKDKIKKLVQVDLHTWIETSVKVPDQKTISKYQKQRAQYWQYLKNSWINSKPGKTASNKRF